MVFEAFLKNGCRFHTTTNNISYRVKLCATLCLQLEVRVQGTFD